MGTAEVAAFRGLQDAEAAVRLRRADEAAKVPGREVPGLASWYPLLTTVAAHVDTHGRHRP